MPSSRPDHIPRVIDVMTQLDPSSVLDVGVGFGKWGHLIREYTDIRLSEQEPQRYGRENWRVRIDGIEGYEDYLTPMHDFLYDRIYVGDMRDVIDRVGEYDTILLGDVIEHIEKADGVRFLRKCLDHCARAVVVSTPAIFVPQDDACGNPLERHRSFWTAADFRAFPGAKARVTTNDILIAVIPAPGVATPEIVPPSPARRVVRRLRSGVRRAIDSFRYLPSG